MCVMCTYFNLVFKKRKKINPQCCILFVLNLLLLESELFFFHLEESFYLSSLKQNVTG